MKKGYIFRLTDENVLKIIMEIYIGSFFKNNVYFHILQIQQSEYLCVKNRADTRMRTCS